MRRKSALFINFVAIFALLFPSILFADSSDGDLDAEKEIELLMDCTDHSNCPAGYYCDSDGCQKLQEGQCYREVDCVPEHEKYCEISSSKCRYHCARDADCDKTKGEYCNPQTFKCEIPQGDEDNFCYEKSDCEVDEFCDLITHKCRLQCKSEKDCEEGEICTNKECVPGTPADGDQPWLDYETDIEPEDEFEVPEDYEMPESKWEYEKEEEQSVNPYYGGDSTLTDCKPGEVCRNDSGGSGSSGSCNSAGTKNGMILMGLLVFAFLLRTRKKSKSVY